MSRFVTFLIFTLCMSTFSEAQNASEDFTIIVIPDTQHYLGPGTKIEDAGEHPLSDLKNEPYVGRHIQWAAEQTFPEDTVVNPYLERHIDWILKNREPLNIVFVSHVGDIVEINRKAEWKVAAKHLNRLRGIVPFGLTVGNHDMKNRGNAELFQKTFPASSFADNDWYLASYDHDGKETEVSRNNVNSVQQFTAGGIDFLFLHLECNAPDDVLKWANEIIRAHPEHRILITTHMDLGIVDKPKSSAGYIDDPKGRMNWSKVHGKHGNTAKQMWKKCYRLHPNLDFVFSGDQSRVTAFRLDEKAEDGHVVHSLLSDYQSLGGIRILTFRPGEKRVDVTTYDTMLNEPVLATPYVKAQDQHQFSLDWDPGR